MLIWSYMLFATATLCRAVKRLLVGRSNKTSNKRILIVTDYVPPQTHGIAIRFQHYIRNMQAHGHEVHVFSPKMPNAAVTSFYHPNMCWVVNPCNKHNKLTYNGGTKLSWYLGAYHWDVVHLVYPSLMGWFLLPLCAWRAIPTYCSHHVDMELYFKKYLPEGIFLRFATLAYWFFYKFPAIRYGSLNTSMTRVFLREHMPSVHNDSSKTGVIPTGVDEDKFRRADSTEQAASERKALEKRVGAEKGERIVVMVQRLAPEKEIWRAFPAARELAKNGEKVRIVIVGHGPEEDRLRREAKGANVVFLGRIPNEDLPPIYRSADAFLTCSRSETYGLTVLEALACGCPVVMPHCTVFDELWQDRLPSSWLYSTKKPGELAKSISAASRPEAREWLVKNPVRASWKDATEELLKQYDVMIAKNMPNKRYHLTWIRFLSFAVRVVIISFALLITYSEFRVAKRFYFFGIDSFLGRSQ